MALAVGSPQPQSQSPEGRGATRTGCPRNGPAGGPRHLDNSPWWSGGRLTSGRRRRRSIRGCGYPCRTLIGSQSEGPDRPARPRIANSRNPTCAAHADHKEATVTVWINCVNCGADVSVSPRASHYRCPVCRAEYGLRQCPGCSMSAHVALTTGTNPRGLCRVPEVILRMALGSTSAYRRPSRATRRAARTGPD